MGNTILPSGEELNSTPEEILRYLNRLSNSGLGKQKTLEYLTKYINKQSTEIDVEKLKMKNIKEDVLQIEHSFLNTIESIATMDDAETFKTLGYMCGVNEMADEIIKLIDEERKVGGIDEKRSLQRM